ncbi:MAG: hypothetical protein HY360_05780 [Verrucomicrobia bacterium]|nr:hypothetical protein [Verrucomicrobiota bacterium]
MNRKLSCKHEAPLPRRDCFLGIHQDFHPNARDTGLYADLTAERIGNLLRKVKPDFVQFDCKGHPGYTGYPTKFGAPCPGIAKDALALWRKATRKHGIGLYVHYSGVWDSVACEKHPEWARVDENGKPDPDSTSVFSPYVHKQLIPQLKEAADRYDLDGVWVDGECWAVKPDYSPAALEAFRRATGIADAPRKKEDPHWREFIDFQRQQFLRYVSAYVEALHAHLPADRDAGRPGFQVASNWLFTSFHPEPVTVPVDYLTGDVCVGIDPLRLESRYLSSTRMPWDLMDWGFAKPGGLNNPDTLWSYKTAVQLQREAAVVLAQGGAFQFLFDAHGNRRCWMDDYVVDLAAKVARFCRTRQTCCHKTETVPQVGLLLSREDFYHRTQRVFAPWQGEFNALAGVLHALLECHYSVDVLAEHHLANRMSAYPVIVAPEVEFLEENFRRELKQYVQDGGRLLVIGSQAARLFREMLGVKLGGVDEGARPYMNDVQYFVCQKREPPENMAVSTHLLGGSMLAWSPGPWLKVVPNTARAVGYRFPTHNTRKGRETAATIHRFGRGKVAAIFGPLGVAIHTSHHPALREFLRQVMQSLFPRPLITVRAPAGVEVVLRQREKQLLVHLINTTGAPRAEDHLIVDEIPSVGPVGLDMALLRRPRRVHLAPDGVRPAWRWSKNRLAVEISRLHIHTTLVVQQ